MPVSLITEKDVLNVYEKLSANQSVGEEFKEEILENFRDTKELLMKMLNSSLDLNELEHLKMISLFRTGIYFIFKLCFINLS